MVTLRVRIPRAGPGEDLGSDTAAMALHRLRRCRDLGRARRGQTAVDGGSRNSEQRRDLGHRVLSTVVELLGVLDLGRAQLRAPPPLRPRAHAAASPSRMLTTISTRCSSAKHGPQHVQSAWQLRGPRAEHALPDQPRRRRVRRTRPRRPGPPVALLDNLVPAPSRNHHRVSRPRRHPRPHHRPRRRPQHVPAPAGRGRAGRQHRPNPGRCGWRSHAPSTSTTSTRPAPCRNATMPSSRTAKSKRCGSGRNVRPTTSPSRSPWASKPTSLWCAPDSGAVAPVRATDRSELTEHDPRRQRSPARTCRRTISR